MTHGHDHSQDHHHSHSHDEHAPDHHHHSESEGQAALFGALIVTAIFMLVEVIGGYFANSLALISDGAHMLTDIGALCLSLFAGWLARRPSDHTMSYGYQRAEILGALISGLLIWLIVGLLGYEAVDRFYNPHEVKGGWVLGIAVVGLAANLISMRMLHRHQGERLNIRAAYLHLIADALGSVGAVVAGALILWTGKAWIDPLITFLFAGLMLYGSWGLVKESVSVLMESVPSWVDFKKVQADLQGLTGISQVHDLHIWAMSSRQAALSVHLVSGRPARELLVAAQALLREKHGITHSTIQVEHPEDTADCAEC